MKTKSILILLIILQSATVFAQTCTEEQTAAHQQCIQSCEESLTCVSKPSITVEQLRAAIGDPETGCGCSVVTEEGTEDSCQCESSKVRNFGKYRSCVSKSVNTLAKLGIITEEVKAQLKADNTLCKATIKEQRGNKGNKENKNEKGNKGGKGKGKPE